MLSWLSSLRKPLQWLILLFLPFNLIPFAHGIVRGLILAAYRARVYDDSVRYFIENRAEASYMSYEDNISVEPFHVPKIRDPQAWWEKLGLERFDISPDDGEAPIDHFAALDSLYRKEGSDATHQTPAPWHHWVYISPHQLHIEGMLFGQWDKAFDELLRHHYRNPSVRNSSFHYIPHPRNFLCLQWNTRGPALMHFTTETAHLTSDTEPDTTAVPGYSPVSVRLIEFPLKDTYAASLMPGIFPSPFNQMRSVTENADTWQAFNRYSQYEQLELRLQEMCLERETEYPKSFGRLVQVEDWLLDRVALLSAVEQWFSIVRTIGLFMSLLAWRFGEIAFDTWKAIVQGET